MLDFVNRSCANTVTLFNIVFGSLSLVSTLNGDYKSGAVFILLAGIMDGMDGRIARKLGMISEMGKQLDSLCDLVSFGVAPAILLYDQVLYSVPYIGLTAAIVYIMCGAYRLARFNVLNLSGFFLGVPITLAGAFLAVVSWFAGHLSVYLILAIVVGLAYLMVSNIKIRKV
ncbi:MAG: CDP-diacylglycerol--serine O-phosphatidyltransferase [Syntrophomonas sp.]|nr:CDP-diacylglycerol--serine O-phosphatidyltransferase [Syntrophomonas sp.]